MGYDKGRQTRARIVARGVEQFAASGYAGTSIDQVARAAGLTKGAIYAHFQHKQDLWNACLSEGLAVVGDPPPATGDTGEEQLTELLSWFGQTLSQAPATRALFVQIIHRQAHTPENLDVVRTVLGETYVALKSAINRTNPDIDADSFAFICFAALLLDPDLHDFHTVMTGNTDATHDLSVTVRQLVRAIARPQTA